MHAIATTVTLLMEDGTTLLVMFPITQYIWGPDRVLAKIDKATNKSYYYLYNGHGDVVQIVDTNGNIKNSYDYDVWGNFLKKEETIENHFTYFGQIYDEETGLYYLRARYYDPTTGRFTQQDPAEDEYNWYVYGNQNPVMYVDYLGLDAIWITNEDSVSIFGKNMGHTSLLLEDNNGDWYYFYWGASKQYPIDFKKVALKRIDDSSALESLSSLNEWLAENDLPGVTKTNGYDSSVYIEGDFNASVKAASALAEKWYAGGLYSGLTNNCMQVSTDLIMLGIYEGKWWKNSVLDTNKRIMVPNLAKGIVSTIFGNTSFNK